VCPHVVPVLCLCCVLCLCLYFHACVVLCVRAWMRMLCVCCVQCVLARGLCPTGVGQLGELIANGNVMLNIGECSLDCEFQLKAV
jgi:hypothetical protein